MKKNLLLFISSLSLMLSACGVQEHHKEMTQSDFDALDNALNNTEIHASRDVDTTPLTIPNEDPYTDLTRSVIDFDDYLKSNADLSYTIVDKNMSHEIPYADESDLIITPTDVSLYDNRGRTYEFKQFNATTPGVAYISFSSSIFSRKNIYYLELNNTNLKFEGKDDDINRLTFYTMNRGNDVNRDVSYKTDIIDIDSTKVYYYDEDGYSPYFVYSEILDLNKDDVFRIRNPQLENDDIDTTYGKFISINPNPNGAGFMVRYEPAKGADIYDSLSINDSKTLSEEDAVYYYNEGDMGEQLAQSIIHNPSVVTTVYGLMNYFGVEQEKFERSVVDWGSRIDIKFDTSYDMDTQAFTFGVSAGYTFYPEENLTITLKLSYKQTWRFDVTASVEIETEFFVPVGIDYTLKVVEDTQKEVSFGICVSYSYSGEYDEEKTEQDINEAVQQAFQNRDDWQKHSIFNGESGSTTPGGATYPIFKIVCTYFLPIEIYFDVEFYWELVPTLEAIIKYASHTQRVDVCVSSDDGADTSSDSGTKTNSDLSFTFIGKVHFEVGFRVSIGVDLIGLYKFFHVEFYFKIYGAIDILGYLFMDISWNDDLPPSLNVQGGCKFEISVGLKVGFDLYLLFGGYTHEFPIVAVVLFGAQVSNPFQKFVNDTEEIYIHQNDYDSTSKQFNLTLGQRHLLAARVFNPDTFSVDIKDMEYNDKVKAVYGAFVSEDVEFNVFKLQSIEAYGDSTLPDSFGLSTDGHMTLDTVSGQDNFDAVIKIEVNSAVTFGEEPVKTIIVHFVNSDRQKIYIDDELLGSFVNGAVIQLPVPDPIRYMKFTGYECMDGLFIAYDETKPEEFKYTINTYEGMIDMMVMESKWVDYYHWEVYFMDGFNNLIEKQMVLNGENAVEPDEATRDRYMIANPPDDSHHYEFVMYDHSLENISGPTVIRALYRIVSN